MEKPAAPPAPITCGPENVEPFRQTLRAALGDEGMVLVRAFYDAGLIDGLRGVRIGPLGSLQRPGGVCPTLSDAAESRLADLAWKREQEAAK